MTLFWVPLSSQTRRAFFFPLKRWRNNRSSTSHPLVRVPFSFLPPPPVFFPPPRKYPGLPFVTSFKNIPTLSLLLVYLLILLLSSPSPFLYWGSVFSFFSMLSFFLGVFLIPYPPSASLSPIILFFFLRFLKHLLPYLLSKLESVILLIYIFFLSFFFLIDLFRLSVCFFFPLPECLVWVFPSPSPRFDNFLTRSSLSLFFVLPPVFRIIFKPCFASPPPSFFLFLN